jgi:hypothetical protein
MQILWLSYVAHKTTIVQVYDKYKKICVHDKG